tara:strand:+ start:1308 stop:1781 length:474 start_codon:yes stop_codon:yes gene_type:complete
MSDRFYQQMLTSTGWCPGYRATQTVEEYINKFGRIRRKKMAWDDSRKQEAVDLYTEADPTPETSMEIVADIADQMGESVNGVRMILTKAGVYVKKTPAARSSSSGGNGGGRVSVADAQNSLTNALTDAGLDVDSAIISKLTGKAAVYFTSVVEKLNQ